MYIVFQRESMKIEFDRMNLTQQSGILTPCLQLTHGNALLFKSVHACKWNQPRQMLINSSRLIALSPSISNSSIMATNSS